MAAVLQKFATQVDEVALAQLRALAKQDGRQLQTLVDEALRDYIDKRKHGTPRPAVMTAFGESLAEFDTLYAQLAK